jgi:ATP-binding cassette subfamily C (CFTR/MRP) protein 1
MTLLCPNDNAFGPIVGHCRGTFDFTVKFEEIILGILPQCLFVLPLILQTWTLPHKKSEEPRSAALNVIWILKEIACLLFTVANLLTLISAAVRFPRHYLIVLSCLELFVSALISFLVRRQHAAYRRPSHMVQFYFFVIIICSAVRIRTLSLIDAPAMFMSTTCIKFVLAFSALILESLPGVLLSKAPLNVTSPDDYMGVFSVCFMFYIDRLFWQGKKTHVSYRILSAKGIGRQSPQKSSRVSLATWPPRMYGRGSRSLFKNARKSQEIKPYI